MFYVMLPNLFHIRIMEAEGCNVSTTTPLSLDSLYRKCSRYLAIWAMLVLNKLVPDMFSLFYLISLGILDIVLFFSTTFRMSFKLSSLVTLKASNWTRILVLKYNIEFSPCFFYFIAHSSWFLHLHTYIAYLFAWDMLYLLFDFSCGECCD